VLRGQEQRQPSEGTVGDAVAAATTALAGYLQRQFVDAGTRFGPEGLTALIGEEAAERVGEDQRRALGELALEVQGTNAEPVVAQAVVLTDGDELLSVTMIYELDVEVTLADGSTERLRQRGQLLFPAQEGEAWQAEMLEMDLEAALGAPEGTADEGTEEPAEETDA
jgi:hypothetical protein